MFTKNIVPEILSGHIFPFFDLKELRENHRFVNKQWNEAFSNALKQRLDTRLEETAPDYLYLSSKFKNPSLAYKYLQKTQRTSVFKKAIELMHLDWKAIQLYTDADIDEIEKFFDVKADDDNHILKFAIVLDSLAYGHPTLSFELVERYKILTQHQQPELQLLLGEAIKHEAVEVVKHLLNETDIPLKEWLLLYAVRTGNKTIVELLLNKANEQKASVNITQMTLLAAVYSGSVELVKYLFTINPRLTSNYELFLIALKGGHDDLINFIRSKLKLGWFSSIKDIPDRKYAMVLNESCSKDTYAKFFNHIFWEVSDSNERRKLFNIGILYKKKEEIEAKINIILSEDDDFSLENLFNADTYKNAAKRGDIQIILYLTNIDKLKNLDLTQGQNIITLVTLHDIAVKAKKYTKLANFFRSQLKAIPAEKLKECLLSEPWHSHHGKLIPLLDEQNPPIEFNEQDLQIAIKNNNSKLVQYLLDVKKIRLGEESLVKLYRMGSLVLATKQQSPDPVSVPVPFSATDISVGFGYKFSQRLMIIPDLCNIKQLSTHPIIGCRLSSLVSDYLDHALYCGSLSVLTHLLKQIDKADDNKFLQKLVQAACVRIYGREPQPTSLKDNTAVLYYLFAKQSLVNPNWKYKLPNNKYLDTDLPIFNYLQTKELITYIPQIAFGEHFFGDVLKHYHDRNDKVIEFDESNFYSEDFIPKLDWISYLEQELGYTFTVNADASTSMSENIAAIFKKEQLLENSSEDSSRQCLVM